MLTTPSLDVLQRVAESPKLRKYVQHVWFNPDCYTNLVPACAPEADIECDDAENESEDERIEITQREDLLSEEDMRRWRVYQEVMRDRANLLSGDAMALQHRLETILDQLSNVKILGMRRSEDHRPWGWSKLKNVIGEDPRVIGPIYSQPNTSLSDSTKLFVAFMSAVSTTETRLQRLYTDAVEVDNIPIQWLRESTLRKALQSILYLEINVSKAWVPMISSPNYRVLREENKYGDGLLKVFQAAAPSLLELGLQIFPELPRNQGSSGGPPYGLEYWRQRSYQYLTFAKVVENVRFERLERLKLEKIVTTPALLEGFLSASKDSLTSLKMRDIRLISGEDVQRPWDHVFAFLQTSVPKLSYVLFHRLLYTHGGIAFVEKPDVRAPQATDSRGGSFREYEHITLEATCRESVVTKLEEVKERHWYCGHVYSYAMDDDVWHTDTSMEDW